MKHRNFWLFSTIFLVAWSLWSIYPPRSQPLLDAFRERAALADTNVTAIVQEAERLQAANPNNSFQNLLSAIQNQNLGSNGIAPYFPGYTVPAGKDTNRTILYALQHEAAGKIKLGLDLQGGMSFLVELQTNKLAEGQDRARVVEQAVEVLRKRVDRFGVAEPVIQPAGEDRILIQLPGLSEAEKESARTQISRAAFLEFRMVHPESDELLRDEAVAPGYEVLTETRKREDGQETLVPYFVSKRAERGLTGKHVTIARVVNNPLSGQPEIEFELDREGADKFAQITREYSPRGNKFYQLAIVLDGQLYSAPRINGEIPSGRAQITGSFDIKEAFELANVLQNPLEAPVKILEERSVDPSLGKASIRSGVTAAVMGTLAVAAFMLVYYLLGGLVANLAMVLNLIVLLGVMCYVETTLTLPGIAGIVLTIGMAVDANVLIFERIREELAAGKSLRGAVTAGYSRAFGTIFDSNLTTLIASVILIYLGSGPVKGFGVTLTIGITVSMFTSLAVTRLIFDTLLSKNWLRTFRMLHIIRGSRFDFLKSARICFVLSWVVILAGLGWGLKRGGKALGVDFAGGDELTFRFKQRVEEDALREAIGKVGAGDPTIQYQRDLTTGSETLRITTASGKGAEVESALKASFEPAGFERIGLFTVGATVGSEIQRSALLACFWALFGILVYVAFRYEFSFAVGAVIAVIHDVLMALGIYFLAGRELSGPTIAALLTIIGFSINDTIVIFDRIREDLRLGVRGSFAQLINQALNQTLSRTIITSGTVFLATSSLLVFGGPGAINDFAFTFLVGIITGTYSSIYIASALVLWWHKGERPKIGAEILVEGAPAVKAA
jgi:SecD/SecF fusion protein